MPGLPKMNRGWMGRQAYRAAGVLISLGVAALIGRLQITSGALSTATGPSPEPIAGIAGTVTQTVSPTATPTLTATLTSQTTGVSTPIATIDRAQPYQITSVEPPHGLGIQRLYIANLGWPVQQTPIHPSELRLPSENLKPDTGRYGDIRGAWRLTHLGSDYFNRGEGYLVPPAGNAILAATVYLQRTGYTAVAVDMSGNIQMYLVTLHSSGGTHSYLICYAHLRPDSNEQAIAQAEANAGRVGVMGRVDIVSADNPNPSDMHIAVIDILDLLSYTSQDDLHNALVELFSDRLPRTNQQYPDIFERPEDIFPALELLLNRFRNTTPTANAPSE